MNIGLRCYKRRFRPKSSTWCCICSAPCSMGVTLRSLTVFSAPWVALHVTSVSMRSEPRQRGFGEADTHKKAIADVIIVDSVASGRRRRNATFCTTTRRGFCGLIQRASQQTGRTKPTPWRKSW
jgi:hypothetical protein